MALAFVCFRSIGFAHQMTYSVVIMYGRSLWFSHPAGSTNEGEALAMADTLDKAKYYFGGFTNLIIAVDHKPLLKTDLWIKSL